MRAIPAKAVDFTAKHEGKRLKAYPDPASGGKPYTIGYGPPGQDVVPGMTVKIGRAAGRE